MTNHETFAKIFGIEEPIHVEAMKMIIAQLEDNHPDIDFGWCLKKYKALIDWLNEEA